MSARTRTQVGALLLALAGTACSASTPGRSAPSASSVPSPPSPSAASAAPIPTPAPSSAPAPSAVPPTKPAAKPLVVKDVTFVSTRTGWALGTGALARTTDGGATWVRLPAPPPAVTRIRFASTTTGYSWAEGGVLWVSTDGAASWRHAGLGQVVTLAAAHGTVWALAGPRPYPKVWRATVGGGFRAVGPTPGRTNTLAVHGRTAYVVGQEGAGPVAPSLDVRAGSSVTHRSLPCPRNKPVPRAALGISTDGSLLLDCLVRLPSGSVNPQAYLSTNAGRTWAAVIAPPPDAHDITAVIDRLFAWGTNVYVRLDGRWKVSLAGTGDFVLVGFQDDTHGVALGADGVLHLTMDAGMTWTTATV